jgi:serine/threonine protein kinase/tetratricopeptide (TPR) repeat protein
MTPQQWQQIKDLLQTALELEPGERASYLDVACQGQSFLRHEVESLIGSYASGAFLETPILGVAPVGIENESTAWRAGRHLGAYEIIDQIAIGGMGTVYRAVRADGHYQHQVAVKIVRSDLSTKLTASRFRNERQILASLDHPNIARLLDGGTTTDGLPYFVMELIVGLPITAYCDQHKLTVDARLRLFRMVCSAVQYAHQHLVIHRDIKPSNILITEAGAPKLLDFGIAKILEPGAQWEETTATGPGWLMTPEYASPEQLSGGEVTTATDVHALGLVLYQLLTGHHAWRPASPMPHEIARAVLESEPDKPSMAVWRTEEITKQGEAVHLTPDRVSSLRGDSPDKLARRLAGDLDNIVMKAIRRSPADRYATVDQFSNDIGRHLAGLPVTARKDTLGYRSAKFVRRHTWAVTAVALVLLTLSIGLAATLREARIARAERTRAQQRFNDVRELASANLFELHDAIEQLSGSGPARHLVIQRALQYLDKLSQEAAGDRDLMREMAVGYEKIAELQGNVSGAAVGDSKAALASYLKALTIREWLVAGSRTDVKELKEEGALLSRYSRSLLITGRTDEASRIAQRASAVMEQIVRSLPQDPGALTEEAQAQLQMATIFGGNGASASTREIREAIVHDRKAISILSELARTHATELAQAHRDVRMQRAIAIAREALAFHLSKARDFAESASIYEEVLSEEQTRRSLSDSDLSVLYNHRGLMLERAGDQEKASAVYREDLRLSQSVAKADPSDLSARLNLAIAEAHVGVQEFRLGHPSQAKRQLDAAIESGERMLASNSTEWFIQSLLVAGYAYQGELLSTMGDQEEARARYSKSLATAVAISQHDPEDLESRLSIAKIHGALGVVLARATRYSDARRELDTSLSLADDLLRIRPRDNETLYLSGLTHDHVAAVGGCMDGRRCSGTSRLQLPSLVN